MDLIIAFVLGAGTVVAGRRGKRFLTEAIGWTARRTGYFSKQAAIALDAAKRKARQEYTRGQETYEPIVIDADDGDDLAGHDHGENGLSSNGVSSSTSGFVP